MTKNKNLSPFSIRWRMAALILITASPLLAGCQFSTGSGELQTDNFIGCAGVTSLTSQNVTSIAGVNSPLLGSNEIAQSFVPEKDILLKALSLNLAHATDPNLSNSALTGKLTLVLDIDYPVTSAPADRELGRVTIATESVPKSATFMNFIFNEAIALRANNRYWIRLGADYAPSVSNYIGWVGDPLNGYPNGGVIFKMGTGWSTGSLPSSLDLDFNLGCSP